MFRFCQACYELIILVSIYTSWIKSNIYVNYSNINIRVLTEIAISGFYVVACVFT